MTRRKQCATISSVYRVIYRAKVPTNWPIKSPDQEHIGRKWTSTPIKKKLAVDLRATIHKYRGQIYGTKCKCYVLLCQTWVRHLWDLAPHPHPTLQLLPKPRQAEVLKRQLNNDSLKKKTKNPSRQNISVTVFRTTNNIVDTFLTSPWLPSSVLSLHNYITCDIINLPPHPLLVIVTSDHKYSQQRTSYQTGRWQSPPENWVISNKCKHLDLMYCSVETPHCQLLN